METNYLAESDYTKILSFIAATKNYHNDYQQHVLNQLNEIFGYQYSTFNLINHNLELCNTRLFNISEKSKNRYYEYYHKTDIFDPRVILNLHNNKKVVAISDIMPTAQYENTEFYLDFLKEDMLYYELAIPLKINNDLIGGIGVFKQKDDPFTDRDIAILNRVNEFIASEFWTFLQYSNINKECQVYSNYFDETPAGVIIIDKRCSIIRYNKAAEAFAANLQLGNSPYDSMKHFIHEAFSKFSHKLKNDRLDFKFYYKSYKITIIYNLISSICEGLDPVYMIFITEGGGEKWGVPCLPESYNLTERESEILTLVKNGLSNGEIAETLFISKHTVKAHMENIFKKLKVNNRTAALHRINSFLDKH